MGNMTHSEKISIMVRNCDFNARVRPSSLLWMFQDASEVLTERCGIGPKTMTERKLNWMVARLGCECVRLPICEEVVEMTVWAGKSKMGIYPWQYHISDSEGNTLVRGCALWVLSDMETRSMLSPNVPRIDLWEEEPPYEAFPSPKPLRPAFELPWQSPQTVGYRDTDLNGHMNNACYLDWLCELPGFDFHRDHELKSLCIDYKGETRPGERVDIQWGLENNVLYGRADGKFECCMEF